MSSCLIPQCGKIFFPLNFFKDFKFKTFLTISRQWKRRHSKRILFYRVGIGEKDDERNERGWKIKTLTSLRQMLNHTDTIIDYLKMDIEGGEWPVLDQWLNDGDLSRVKQLAIEIHLDDPETIPSRYALLQRLEASGFVRFFSRENPYTINSYLDKYNVTGASCLELAWYNKNYLKWRNSRYSLIWLISKTFAWLFAIIYVCWFLNFHS